MTTKKVHTLILGAGPSGLAAAYTLAKAGLNPVVLEKGKVWGGLMRSIKRGDFIVDVGRKELYNRIEKVDKLWSALLGDDYRSYPHRGGILFDGNIIDMSPAFQGARRGMRWDLFAACATNFLSARAPLPRSAPTNVAEYFYQKRGRAMTRIFAQGFQEKLTGKQWADIQLPEGFKNGNDSGLLTTVKEVMERAFSKKEVNTFKGVWKHPAKGTGQICDLLGEGMMKSGTEAFYEAQITELAASNGKVDRVVAAVGNESICFQPDHVISSVPLEILIKMLVREKSDPGAKAPYSGQPKRTVVLSYLFLDETPKFPHAWLQVTCPSTRIGRISNYTAFNGDMVPAGKTALCCEFYCFGEDPMLALDNEEIAKITLEDCERSGIVSRDKCIDNLVLRFPGADASQNRDNWMQAWRLKQMEELAPFKNLFCVNRTELDIATVAGMDAAEAIMKADRSDFDRRVDPAELNIRSAEKAFSFDLPFQIK